jgi:hypothetical protein
VREQFAYVGQLPVGHSGADELVAQVAGVVADEPEPG